MTAPVRHLVPTQQAGREFITRGLEGEVVMLNLLRLRDLADYNANPEPTPAFAQHETYLAGIGHRTAAVEDSRLLPLSELPLESAA